MVKQRRFYHMQRYLALEYKKYILSKLIKKSLQQNTLLTFKLRLSYLKINKYGIDKRKLYPSYSKLVCFLSFNKRVPSKHLHLSRFFINKLSNSLTIGPVKKN